MYDSLTVERYPNVDHWYLQGTNDSDFDDEPMITQSKGKDKSRDVEHKPLSVVQLQELVENDINSVANIIGLEVRPRCSTLLCLFSPPLVDSHPSESAMELHHNPLSRVICPTDTYRVHTSATSQLEQRPPH